MNDKLFIPEKIKAGFNPRKDTYSGKLAYVIAFDNKTKKWRKETSWESWIYKYISPEEFEGKRKEMYDNNVKYYSSLHKDASSKPKDKLGYYDLEALKYSEEDFILKSCGSYEKFTPNIGRVSSDETLKPVEFDNVPMDGFVLNKKVGGYSSGWNHRSTYCRVFDPRGFEFEISVPNLLFILQECNAYKGKGLEGSFVYSWDGKDLVLLPTSSLDYKESTSFTQLQTLKISSDDFQLGCSYKHKNTEDYIYIGRFNWFDFSVSKKHVFYNVKHKTYESFSGAGDFAKKLTDISVDNYAELLDGFNNSRYVFNTLKVTEEEYIIQTKINSYRKDNGVIVYKKIDEKSYEAYLVKSNKTTLSGSYYSSRDITSYDVELTHTVTLDNENGFKIKKPKNPKIFINIGKKTLNDLNLIELTYNKTKLIFK